MNSSGTIKDNNSDMQNVLQNVKLSICVRRGVERGDDGAKFPGSGIHRSLDWTSSNNLYFTCQGAGETAGSVTDLKVFQ